MFEILQVLESTVNLTNLQLDRVVADNRAQLMLPFVSLPKLVHLDLNVSDKLTPGTVLLEHLRIPTYCAVIFTAPQIQHGEIWEESTFGPIITTISTCAQRCLPHYLPQRLQVVMTRASFLFEATDWSRKLCFSVWINIAPHRQYGIFPHKARSTLLHQLFKSGLSKVTYLELDISRTVLYVPGLDTLIERLPSVDTLITEKPFLLDLCRNLPLGPGWINPPPSASNFPMLKILRLRSFTFSQLCSKSRKDRDPVSRYIMGRITCGYATISVIDLTEMVFDILPNMEFLSNVNGVKVLWRKNCVSGIQEYTSSTSARSATEA